jgi:hypothetical protein
MPIFLMDTGLAAIVLGLVSLVRPLAFVGLGTRRLAAAALGAGVLLVLVAVAWPAPLRRSVARSSRLDAYLPAWQFAERHEIRVHAPPERTYAAVRAVTAGEIRLFRTLTWIRSPRLPWTRRPASILNAPADRPILEVAASSGFLPLAEEPGREVVLGTLVIVPERHRLSSPEEFAALERPGYAKAAINFLVEDEGGGWCRVITETRVFATDPRARLRFAAYWRIIAPGSAFLRWTWLGAIRRRAERTG